MLFWGEEEKLSPFLPSAPTLDQVLDGEFDIFKCSGVDGSHGMMER